MYTCSYSGESFEMKVLMVIRAWWKRRSSSYIKLISAYDWGNESKRISVFFFVVFSKINSRNERIAKKMRKGWVRADNYGFLQIRSIKAYFYRDSCICRPDSVQLSDELCIYKTIAISVAMLIKKEQMTLVISYKNLHWVVRCRQVSLGK